MGAFAVVKDHQIVGQCTHLIPLGTGTTPMAFPFMAPIKEGLIDTVLIMGDPAAVKGSKGANEPTHPGLHPTDQFFEPSPKPRKQVGEIKTGSATVFFGGQAAATIQSQASCCRAAPPGKLVPGIPTVLIG